MNDPVATRAQGRRTAPVRSYRGDSAVPAFPDDGPLLVFDGVCVLCSGFARFVLRADRAARFRFVTAQSTLGRSLFRHYGWDPVEFETNLLIVDGRAFAKLAAFAEAMRLLPWPWKALSATRLLPRPLADRLYDTIARNRYAVFGRRDACAIPPPEFRDRFLG